MRHDCSLMCDNCLTELEMICCDKQLHNDNSGDVKHVLNITMVVLCVIIFFQDNAPNSVTLQESRREAS